MVGDRRSYADLSAYRTVESLKIDPLPLIVMKPPSESG
jgi:hypothetical protein